MLLNVHKTKIKQIEKIIAEGLETMQSPYLSLSWGKDSSLLMWFVRQQKQDIPCVYINSGYALPDTYTYRDMMLDKYDINYIEIKNEVDYIELCKKQGLPHERSEYEQNQAVKALKKNQADGIAAKYGFDGCFWGIRAEEAIKRTWMIKHNGTLFKSKSGLYRCSPIAYLTTDDVFDIASHIDLPLNTIYTKTQFTKRNKIRNSGWLSTDGAKDGSVKWLKYYYPEYFNKLSLLFPEIRGYV